MDHVGYILITLPQKHTGERLRSIKYDGYILSSLLMSSTLAEIVFKNQF